MATLSELCEQHELEQLGGGLDENEQPGRLLYALPHVVDWLENALPALDPILDEGRQSPLQQVDDLFHDFVSGEDLAFYERSHSMLPAERGIWELKTPDVRLFGWFWRRGVFVIANINSAFLCKKHDLYAGYRDDTVRRRDALGLDLPKFLSGDYDHVL